MNMKKFIEPKSDQLNGDDLIAGNRVIKITKVKVTETGTQDCTIWYEGDNGKPWKPCKTMGRVLVYAWGDQIQNYVGRYVELYRDPKALWAGQEVGGIRIWALSDIDKDFDVSLTVTRGNKKPFHVRKLQPPKETPQFTIKTSKAEAHFDNVDAWEKQALSIIDKLTTPEMCKAFLDTNLPFINAVDQVSPETAKRVEAALAAKNQPTPATE